jgi:acetyl-CoA synthetase
MTSHHPLADHYGQSETGMIVNCHWGECLTENTHPSSFLSTHFPVGTMGRSMPGYRCVTLNEDEVEVEGSVGQLAIDIPSSPLFWFRGYWNQPHRTAKCHSKSNQYYLTGDLVHQGHAHAPSLQKEDHSNPALGTDNDDTSLFWYLSRNDDIITSSGYRIGPSDIERCLLRDHRVKDVGVYGITDPEGLKGEIIVASVVLHLSYGIRLCSEVEYEKREEQEKERALLTIELQKYIGDTLSKHCKPKKILFQTNDLPRTPSGKIQRYKLREEFHRRK